ncbi:hypothetical protein [Halodesulfovibrio marinisediminis]|uniref:Uncharacterized protein n=1 Tax=Halodesulfovibrio marinisediminis DSM 17456 TaxID=1121457 RepID=A0A1N6I9Y2_9BACT|nr:hypothetical protein [Halodesulfovibrio marinisediminis]SIO28837.1 hypothetical protein SAMN02745161_2558 [Halodesulfovibrio marinisediminis DSM 17456]
MNINSLSSMATSLQQVGKEHLTLQDGSLTPKTSSLGGRILNWIRSRKPEGKSPNLAVASRLLNTMQSTDGITDAQKSYAEKLLHKALESGRPISGREAAKTIREFVSIKTSEDSYAKESRMINAQGLTKHMLSGTPSKFDACVNSQAERFGLSKDQLTGEEVSKMKQQFETHLLQKAAMSDHSLSEKEGSELGDEVCRMAILGKTQAAITSQAKLVTSHNSMDDPLPNLLFQEATKRGLDVPVRLDLMEGLSKSIEDKLFNACLLKEPCQQPTFEKASEIALKVVNKHLDCMQTIQESDLGSEQKMFAMLAVSSSKTSFTKGMTEGMCSAIPQATDFILQMQDSSLSDNPEQVKNACENYFHAMKQSTDVNDEELREGIAGGPEASAVRTAIGLTALATCSGIQLGEGEKDIERSENMYNALTNPGAPLAGFMYDTQQAQGNGAGPENVRMQHYLASVLSPLAEEGKVVETLLPLPLCLGNLSYAQIKQRGAEEHQLPPSQLQTLKQNVEARFLPSVDNEKTYSPANSPVTLSPETTKKYEAFGEQFMKDFLRTGVTIDGEHIGACGTNDSKAIEEEVNKLISKFPSIEEAAKICSPLHQGCMADVMTSAFKMPELTQTAVSRIHIKDRVEAHHISIKSHGGGEYTASMDYAKHGEKIDDPETRLGENVLLSYQISTKEDQQHASFALADLDIRYSKASF